MATCRRHPAQAKTWVATQLQRSGGRLYQWAQRLGALEDLTTLAPGPVGATQTLGSRLADARTSWSQLWQGGEGWCPSFNDPLPPITGTQIREVVSRLRKGKAHGADGWRPQELAALPDAWLEALASCYKRWEAQGRWPKAVSTAIIALCPRQVLPRKPSFGPLAFSVMSIVSGWPFVSETSVSGPSAFMGGGILEPLIWPAPLRLIWNSHIGSRDTLCSPSWIAPGVMKE